MGQEKGWSLTLQLLWQVVHDETKFYNLIMRYSDFLLKLSYLALNLNVFVLICPSKTAVSVI